jgi:hypothetical protein
METAEVERVLAGLAHEVDDRKEIAWYGDRSAVALVVGEYLKLYFGRREEKTLALRLKLQREWDGAPRGCDLLLDVDGLPFRIPTEPTEWMRDEGAGRVWDIVDLPLSLRAPALLSPLARAAEVRVRLDAAASSWTWSVPAGQLEGAARVLAAWRSLTEGPGAGR